MRVQPTASLHLVNGAIPQELVFVRRASPLPSGRLEFRARRFRERDPKRSVAVATGVARPRQREFGKSCELPLRRHLATLVRLELRRQAAQRGVWGSTPGWVSRIREMTAPANAEGSRRTVGVRASLRRGRKANWSRSQSPIGNLLGPRTEP